MGWVSKLWLLFAIAITASAVIAVAANSQQQYFEEDDDFGDFDNEGDMIEDVDTIPGPDDDDFDEGPDETQGKEAAAVPVQKLVMAPVEEEDEAIVENEDGDEFSHLTDEEEFIGYTGEGVGGGGSSRSHQARKDATKEPKITIANVPLHLRSNWDSFYLELLLLAGLLIYFTNFSFGRTKNARLATAWYDAHKPFLLQQFALVGDDGKAVADSNSNGSTGGSTEKSVVTSSGGCAGLQKESENVYTLYCSGRSCVHSMMVELRFIKRQDLVSVLAQVLRPSNDEVVIRMQLDEMDSFVLCMAAKKMAAKYVKEMTDITTYCPGDRKTPLPSKQYGSGSTSSKFVVWSELVEAVTAVLGDQRTVAVLSKHLAKINYLHISDQYSGPRQPDQDQQQTLANAVKMPEVHKVIIMSFQLLAGDPSKTGNSNTTVAGTQEDMEALRPLIMLALHLADKLNRLRLSKESKAKAARNRSRVEEAFLKATHAVRAERAQEKREEKKRTEREKIMEIDDPEKQRKWEERENRRAAKSKGPKMKQLKVA